MKNTHICPKCGGSDLVRIEGKVNQYGNVVLTGVTVFSAVPVQRYVCCSCGFSEEWFDEEHLDQLRSAFQ
ncbi:MAG: hypothetical protein IJ484_04415 [Oscillospiraceae bacterium]|nr:hypothetical protein [Oscillospiraceae bacterium]